MGEPDRSTSASGTFGDYENKLTDHRAIGRAEDGVSDVSQWTFFLSRTFFSHMARCESSLSSLHLAYFLRGAGSQNDPRLDISTSLISEKDQEVIARSQRRASVEAQPVAAVVPRVRPMA